MALGYELCSMAGHNWPGWTVLNMMMGAPLFWEYVKGMWNRGHMRESVDLVAHGLHMTPKGNLGCKCQRGLLYPEPGTGGEARPSQVF